MFKPLKKLTPAQLKRAQDQKRLRIHKNNQIGDLTATYELSGFGEFAGAFKKLKKAVKKVTKAVPSPIKDIVKTQIKVAKEGLKTSTGLVNKISAIPIVGPMARVAAASATGGTSEVAIQAANTAQKAASGKMSVKSLAKSAVKSAARGALSSATGGTSETVLKAASTAKAIKKGGVKGLATAGASYATGGSSDKILSSVKTVKGYVATAKSLVKPKSAVQNIMDMFMPSAEASETPYTPSSDVTVMASSMLPSKSPEEVEASEQAVETIDANAPMNKKVLLIGGSAIAIIAIVLYLRRK